MKESYKYTIKSPSECSDFEIDEFYKSVLEGGKVHKDGLKKRIKNCVVLGFCNYNDILIGVSSIKRPQKKYVQKIITKAKLPRTSNDLEFEIGYSFTQEAYRREGVSANIKLQLIERMKNVGGKIFSTTAISSSQKFLVGQGFKQIGNPYDGNNDKDLKYYELIIKI